MRLAAISGLDPQHAEATLGALGGAPRARDGQLVGGLPGVVGSTGGLALASSLLHQVIRHAQQLSVSKMAYVD